jgi:hypothetical protein
MHDPFAANLERRRSETALAFRADVAAAVRPGATLLDAFNAIEDSNRRHCLGLGFSCFMLTLTCRQQPWVILPSLEPGSYTVTPLDDESSDSGSRFHHTPAEVRAALVGLLGACQTAELRIRGASPLRWHLNSSGVLVTTETES